MEIELLYKEHDLILAVLDKADDLAVIADEEPLRYLERMQEVLDFLRDYADGYHHQKEEEILFPAMSKRNEMLEQGILAEMLHNHEEFRELMQQMRSDVERQNSADLQYHFRIYSGMLRDHIAVENDEVFQIAETIFSSDELEKIVDRFTDADRTRGLERKQALAAFASREEKVH